MVCISHVIFAFYVASFLFARNIWLCHGSFDNIRSQWIFDSLWKCYQILTRLFSTWISEWIDVVLFDCVYIYRTYVLIYYIRYSWYIQIHFKVSDILSMENVWHFPLQYRHRNWSPVANWRTSGGGAASWLTPEVMGRNDALNRPGFVVWKIWISDRFSYPLVI